MTQHMDTEGSLCIVSEEPPTPDSPHTVLVTPLEPKRERNGDGDRETLI